MGWRKRIGSALILGALVTAFNNCSKIEFDKATNSENLPQCRGIDADEVKPVLLWDWKAQLASFSGAKLETFDQVMSTPMVADLDGDKKPEVVFVTFSRTPADWYPDATGNALHNKNGVLRIVNGQTGKPRSP